MKMSKQNPGGDGALKGSMGGHFKEKGTGGLKTYPGPIRKADVEGRGNLSPADKAHAAHSRYHGGHALTSTKGSTVTGSSKACR